MLPNGLSRMLPVLVLLAWLADRGLACPSGCHCALGVADCRQLGLTSFPGQELDPQTIRLMLSGNRISRLDRSSLHGLDQLEILNLAQNQLTELPSDWLDEARNLRRVRLAGNQLTKIDLHALARVRYVDLSGNLIQCIPPSQSMADIITLDLHDNRIRWISAEVFAGMPHLRVLNLTGNPLHCDCQLKPLMELISRDARVASLVEQSGARCDLQSDLLSGQVLSPRVASLMPYCASTTTGEKLGLPALCLMEPPKQQPDTAAALASSISRAARATSVTAGGVDDQAKHAAGPDQTAGSCETGACLCKDNKAKCLDRGLQAIPQDLPTDIVELELSNNSLKVLPQDAFARYGQLRKLGLSNNQLVEIHENAFQGLPSLRSLSLAGNKLRHLQAKQFAQLKKLSTLFLQQNRLSCIGEDAFQGLESLLILHLSENKLQYLPKRLFHDNRRLRYLYLGRNPFTCDCHNDWLPEFLKRTEAANRDLATCHSPSSLHQRPLKSLRVGELECMASDEDAGASARWSMCGRSNQVCPSGCSCHEMLPTVGHGEELDELEEVYGPSISVNCDYRNWTSIPEPLPPMTRILSLKGNRIQEIADRTPLVELRILEILDISGNGLRRIHESALSRNQNLKKLSLHDNQLVTVASGLLKPLTRLDVLLMHNNQLERLAFDSFAGVSRSLQVLTLHNNAIRSMAETAIAHLSSLKLISLDGNAFDCSCDMAWLPEWLRRHGNLLMASPNAPTCASPAALAGTRLTSLMENDFTACQCPSPCKCKSDGVVDCTSANLLTVPVGLSAENTRRLLLDRNRISRLRKQDFQHLTNLETISLTGNRIRCVESGTFDSFAHLKQVSLRGNNISSLSPNDLMQNIDMTGNPCNTVAACCSNPTGQSCENPCEDGPCQNGASCELLLASSWPVKEYRCHCPAKYHGLHCEKPLDEDPCPVCLNNGTCTGGQKCQCPNGYHGERCEQKTVKPGGCFAGVNPCENSGRCQPMANNTFTCQCQPGFQGVLCDQNVNDCQFNLCRNGASCVDGVNLYQCSCRPGYRGQFCEINTAQSIQPVTTSGPAMLEGLVSLCEVSRCLNGGLCLPDDQRLTFECKCPSGYSGRFCENVYSIGVPSRMSFAKIQLASEGSLVPYGNFSLVFSLGQAGAEGLLLYHLQQDVFLTVEITRGFLHVLYRGPKVDLAPLNLYSSSQVNAEADHVLELALWGSQLQARLDGVRLVKQEFLRRRSFYRFARSTPVNALTIKKSNSVSDWSLYVGGAPAEVLRQANDQQHVTVIHGLGGACLSNLRLNNELVDFGLLSGLGTVQKWGASGHGIGIQAGCLQQTGALATRPRQFSRAAGQQAHPALCPPELNPCQNGGLCNMVGDQAICTCLRGYSGQHCDKASGCRRDSRLSYLRDPDESSCMSMRQIRVRTCMGHCMAEEETAVLAPTAAVIRPLNLMRPWWRRNRSKREVEDEWKSTCCQPVEYREKPIEFTCTNGTNFKKTVKMVKRCSCEVCG